MAEYWKSLPRKFCDVCKCWFADNKASIDFHERGKRHKENAQKRIKEIQKRGIKDFKKQKELDDEMAKIERAALAAYEKDLKNMEGGDKSQSESPCSKSFQHISPQPFKVVKSVDTAPQLSKAVKSSINLKKKVKNITKKPKEPSIHTTPVETWYEGVTEDGNKYYWNSKSSESQWEAPEEGFISIEEQNKSSYEATSEEPEISEEDKSEDEEKATNNKQLHPMGPQPKADPYGQWVTIEKEEPIEYDLQLPQPSENCVEVVIPLYKDETGVKFKEKVIGKLSDCDSSDITFKKRKFAGSFKRNTRQRTTDDD